jgi:hypothetical protein
MSSEQFRRPLADPAAGGCDRPSIIKTEYEQFHRGIIRLLRRLDRHPGSSAKVQAFGAKLLAMQRAAL